MLPKAIPTVAQEKEYPIPEDDFHKPSVDHRAEIIPYDVDTPRKSFSVLLGGITLEDSKRLSLNGLNFFELSRGLNNESILDIKM